MTQAPGTIQANAATQLPTILYVFNSSWKTYKYFSAGLTPFSPNTKGKGCPHHSPKTVANEPKGIT